MSRYDDIQEAIKSGEYYVLGGITKKDILDCYGENDLQYEEMKDIVENMTHEDMCSLVKTIWVDSCSVGFYDYVMAGFEKEILSPTGKN